MSDLSLERGKIADVNGASLAYVEQGDGEAVVFVHGGISDLRTWETQLPAIARSYRAIAYSRRFARPNPELGSDTSDLSLVAVEDLAALLQKLQAAPAHLVGNSYGAYASLVTAIRYPELVRSLVLAEPPVVPLFVSVPPRVAELLRVLMKRPRTAIGIAQFGVVLARMARHFSKGNDVAAARAFTRGVLGKWAFENLDQDRWKQVLENLDELRAFAHGVAAFPPIDDDGVRGIQMPVLLMTGERSPMHLTVLTDRLEELLPNVERLEIPQASHLMHEDNARAVNDAIVRHLRHVGG